MSQDESVYASTLIVQQISTYIDNCDFDKALDYVRSLTEKEIYEHTWDLCNYLIHVLEKKSDKLCNEYELFAQDALTHIGKYGSAREMLIIILEQSDKFISDEIFVFHMKLFLIIIQRLPLKPSLLTYMNDILSLLKCHLTTIELPVINSDFSGKDLLVFNHDHRVMHLLKLTQFYVDFICQLRDYFSNESTIKVLPTLTHYLIALLEEPLSSLSYEPIDKQESSSFSSIRSLLDCIFTMNSNPISLIDSNEHQSVFVYLILTKKAYFSLLPCVYSPKFYLFLSIPSIQKLSNDRERVMLTEKAATLVSVVCSRLQASHEFDEASLDNNDIHKLIDLLKTLMVQSPARQYAPLTIGAYRYLFQSFNPYGRYSFLRQQLAKTSAVEDSYRTFLCTLVKNEFIFDYQSMCSEIYKGPTLFQLIDFLCNLSNGIQTDLLEIYDCLCSALNFVRFIGLIDKKHINRTLIWTEYLNNFKEKIMKPLRMSIELARAHYKLEMKNKLEENKPIDIDKSAEILVDNQPIPMPSKKQQLETLQSAITKFDILDCILSTLSATFGDL